MSAIIFCVINALRIYDKRIIIVVQKVFINLVPWTLLFCSNGQVFFFLEYISKEKVTYININVDGKILHNINVDEKKT
jgi:hypothetical protein